MSTSNQIGSRPRLPGTLAIGAGALVLGIPVAVAALIFERVYMPEVILGSKEVKAGLDTTKTINFSLLSGPNDAVIAGAYISIISSVLFALGLIVLRHFSNHNIFGWALVFPALVDFFGNVACLAYVFIVNGQHPEASSAAEVPFVNGKYDTDGKLYTKQAWACMMDKFYSDREEWAGKACSDLKTGRLMTIPLVATSVLLLGLALWQVQQRGGLGWLFGRRAKIAAMSRSKDVEYIDLQGNR